MDLDQLFDRRLLVVAGKGGVGKTTVACALALEASRRGRRTLVCEVDGVDRAAQLLQIEPAPLGEVMEARPNVFLMSVEGKAALAEYLGLIIPVRRLLRAVFNSRIYQYFVAAAPGLKELMTIGKIWYEAERTDDETGKRLWDLVIMDAPATGHSLQYLRMPAAARDAFGAGLVKREANRLVELLTDPVRTAVNLVATAEEMPANETVAMFEQLRDQLGMPTGFLFVNRVHDSAISAADVEAPVRGRGSAAGLAREEDSARGRGPGARGDRLDPSQRPPPGSPGRRRGDADGRDSVPVLRGVRLRRAAPGRRCHRRGARFRKRKAAPGVKSIGEVVAQHGVIVCAGSGGVGKTTTAAALAVHGAEQGRRTIVLTIDPARRLADALGIRAMGNEECTVDLDGAGTLSAMMLDQKGAWDKLVERYAPSEEVRERILANRFYQHLSESFAGSQEYMAVEQLAQLHASGSYDLIVVDTPPTRHALDFLDAPQRIADFLDRQVVRWFVKPYFSAGWATLRVVNRTAGNLLRRLEDATGVSALVEISDFFNSMSGLFDGFEERVRGVYRLLRSKSTAFVLVATPEEQVLAEAEYFCHKVAELKIAVARRSSSTACTTRAPPSSAISTKTRCARWSRRSCGAASAATRW